jgi:endonuclease YncB( thermonuclease family)
VKPQPTDCYGRTLARVEFDGVDAKAEQVHAGMAWVFDKYVTDRSLYAVPDKARAAKRVLWADKAPIPTWAWRRSRTKQEGRVTTSAPAPRRSNRPKTGTGLALGAKAQPRTPDWSS